MNPLNPLSEIFLVTFSILYGIMLNSLMGLELFPFGSVADKHCTGRSKERLEVSILVINLLPILIFVFILYFLQQSPQPLTWLTWLDIVGVLGVFFMSFSVFMCYRIMLYIIVRCGERLYYYDYDKDQKKLKLKCVNDEKNKRLTFLLDIDNKKPRAKGQATGIVFYASLLVLGILLTFSRDIISSVLLFSFLISLFLCLVVVILYLSNP